MSIEAMRWAICSLLCTGVALCQCNVMVDMSSAKQLLASKEYDRAAAILDKVSHCDMLSPLESFDLGWLYGRARHFTEALKVFRSVPIDVPDRADHAYAVALSNFELAEYRSTVETLESLAKSEPLNSESANLLGVSYSKLGLYREAETVLTGEMRKRQDSLPAYLNLVTLYADQSKFAEAATVAFEAVKAFPESPEVFIVSGAANTLTGKFEKAHDDFSTAAKLSPGQADPQFFLALTEYKQGQFARAIASLKTAIASGIEDSDLHYLLAECLLKTDDGGGRVPAMYEVSRAIALNPNSVSAHVLRGKLLLGSGRTKEAINDLALAYRKDPASRSAAYGLARAYRTVGKNAEAQQLFAQLRVSVSDSLGEMSQQRLNEILTATDKGGP